VREPGLILGLGLAAIAAVGASCALGQTLAPPQLADPELARADYLENCAGCHGVDGRSAPAQLPELRGRVGWFMCTPESRAYLLRLPNVAHSRIADNAELADMMNYVVFVLGETSAPPGTRAFTRDEVAAERPRALTSVALTVERAKYAEEAIRKCHAPASLRLLYPPLARGE